MSSNATPSLFGIQSTQNATGNFQQQVSHMNTLVNKAKDNQQMQKMHLEIESDLEHLQSRLHQIEQQVVDQPLQFVQDLLENVGWAAMALHEQTCNQQVELNQRAC